MASAGSSGHQAANAARQAADNKWIERTARVGLAARGLVYVLIGILALQIAFVDRAEQADQQGADLVGVALGIEGQGAEGVVGVLVVAILEGLGGLVAALLG